MADYEYNQVYRSDLTGRFYFAKKVRVITVNGKPTGSRVVVGNKVDVTASVQPYLLKKFQLKS